MFRTCITCGANTILGRYVDNHLIVMESEPVTDGEAVLKGDLNAEPTVIFGVDSEADAEFYGVPFESDRYERHECKETPR